MKKGTCAVVLSIDEPTRADVRERLHTVLRRLGIPRIEVECVDGRDIDVAKAGMEAQGLELTTVGPMFGGEIGIWLSNLNALRAFLATDHQRVIIFEDDAVIEPDFANRFGDTLRLVPDDWDFFALTVAPNQRGDFFYARFFDENGGWDLEPPFFHSMANAPHRLKDNPVVATAYQGYQCVATMYSRTGAQRVLDLAQEAGIIMPWDCWLFRENFKQTLHGYTYLPWLPAVVTFDERGTTGRAGVLLPGSQTGEAAVEV